MVGIVGGKLIGADGQAQRGFNVRAFPTAATLAAEALLAQPTLAGKPDQPALPLRRFRP